MAAWIQIRSPNADPRSLKRAKKEGKTASKLNIKRIKSNMIGIKWVNYLHNVNF
jgi:hypothetical protein